MKLGPTDDFPEGRLNDEDEGGLQIAIGIEKGKVFIHFGTFIDWIGFNPTQAREMAASLIEKADQAEVKQ